MNPFFREEFALPYEEAYENVKAQRRMRETPSPPSSPEPQSKARGKKRTRRLEKDETAGLVGGDSDSSALTQDSADEAVGTPQEEAGSATEGEDVGEDDDIDMDNPSPGEFFCSLPLSMYLKDYLVLYFSYLQHRHLRDRQRHGPEEREEE
jgi:MRG-binding protein